MGKIIQLPQHIISRIAAGEVIERPVYAVKELVENAIDAGSNAVSIYIEDAGLKKIMVVDNGEGMSQDDLLESFKPHTTSKVADETLLGIKTLGFRGEALSSIAAVSTLTIQSRIKNEVGGVLVSIESGVVKKIHPIGMPVGTIVTVENLFHTVPARMKFLKSKRTEFRHIVDLISQYALVYPQIRFLLYHNKKVIFDLPVSDRKRRIEKLLGFAFVQHLLPLTSEKGYIQVDGFVARPQFSTRLGSKQFIFVNDRLVSDRSIAAIVKESYGNLLESTHFPVFILFLSIPHESVDINVHPRKEQVSFVNPESILEGIKNTVTATLSSHNLTYMHHGFAASRTGKMDSFMSELLREEVDAWSFKDEERILKNTDVLQIHDMYIVLQTQSSMVLVDQHAAHERILYEQYVKEFRTNQKKVKTVQLKSPVSLDLSISDIETLREYKDILLHMGFELKEKKNSLYMTTVPEIFKDRDMIVHIAEIVEELQKEKKPDIDSVTTKLLEYLACRNAVMAGEKLTKDEAKKLIEKLEKTPNNATCPHGRPTRVVVPVTHLNSLFKR